MNEFELIDGILRELGPVADGGVIGPGDDCSALTPPSGELLVSSIDTLISGVHFPDDGPGDQVGYRAMMVSVSDLAAMGAEPVQMLVAMTLEETDQRWALAVARGMREALEETGGKLLGGNLGRGPRSITVSVHGFCPESELLLRSGAQANDQIFVTGPLGASAAAVALERLGVPDDPLTARYYRPQARTHIGLKLRGAATAAIDVSDGLLQDLGHLCAASGLGAELVSGQIPVADGAGLDHALHGGDDYELLFTAPTLPDGVEAEAIGVMVSEAGIRLDGEAVTIKGYQHFL
ncbi:MAG: thiamine-phosphate kinase [Pseudomonadota bacterium]